MLIINTQKTAAAFILFVAGLAIFFYSCQKEITGNGPDQQPPNLTTKISSSVSGFVTDENELAIKDAVVSMGNGNTITDKYGFFELNNVQVIKEAAVVTVTVPGYFKGIKTYISATGKSAFFRIKLIPKIIAGSIDAATGGNVTLTNGLIVSLPANAIVNAATNAAYTGPVNVAAHWINPVAKELNRIMPGDLRGLDTAGAFKLLTTYGMAAVELTGAGGELLQLAPGKKAILTIPLPPAIAATAPNVIPLWYFDELTGLWKEQGNAVKSGNSYVGEVSHFSYWNCDVPNNYVKFSCTITNAKGVPIQNALVKVSVVSDTATRSGYGYTDSSGYTGGAVPANTPLLLEVFGEYNCLAGLLAKNFTTTTANVSLGSIVIPANYSATITGNVNDCNNAGVTNGFVLMRKDGINFYKPLGKTGTFNFTTTLCSNAAPATFVGNDRAMMKASNALAVTLIPGENAIGTLIACAINTQQFINYSINGTNYSFTTPVDSLFQYAKPQNTPPPIIITAASPYSNTTQEASLSFALTGIATNTSQNLFSFNSPQIANPTRILIPIVVKITEYGIVGQFIAGNFSGTLTGPAPGNISYAITCSFRVRRQE